MLNLEVALRMSNISQKQLAAMAAMDEPILSKILSRTIQATEDQKNRIHTALRVRMSKEKLFQHFNLGPKESEYISIFSARKLPPAIQTQLDKEMAEKIKELKEWRATEPERLEKLARKTAARQFQ